MLRAGLNLAGIGHATAGAFMLALALIGCAGNKAEQQAQAAAEARAVAANEDSECRSYGAEPGSPAYVQCRMNFSNQRAQNDANTRAILLQSILNKR
jgi:hypothetical protein